LGISLSLLLKIQRIKNKKVFIINSGLFEIKTANIFNKLIKKYILKITFKTCEKIIFTSKTEYKFALKENERFTKKFEAIPFCVDVDFWRPDKVDFSTKRGILFIGNNEFRDIKKLIKIAKELQNINFTIVTSLINSEQRMPKNITIIKGDWNSTILTDQKIRELYQNSRITILPIMKNTITSSGQSVAMQSLAAGTPVVINRNPGFWEQDTSVESLGIQLVGNTLNEWCNLISELYNNEKKLLHLSKKGSEELKKNHDIRLFNNAMENLIIN
jgi:glycosyltransferase involved in cell wall biosynthesis